MRRKHGCDHWEAEMQALQLSLLQNEFVISARAGLTRHARKRLNQVDRFPLTAAELVPALLSDEARIIEGTGLGAPIGVTTTGAPIYKECKRLIQSTTRWGTPVHIVVLLRRNRPPKVVTTYDPSHRPWQWDETFSNRK